MVRSVPYADADLVVGVFTEDLGRVSALARRARAEGLRRLALEPMHTLGITLRERSAETLMTLTEAAIAVPRPRLIGSFGRMAAAGIALRWVQQATPARTPEPDVWCLLEGLLEDLDEPELCAPEKSLVVVMGLRLLQALGYGLELDRCIACGRECPVDRSAYVDAARGGLVCRRCGGTGLVLSSAARSRLKGVVRGDGPIEPEDLTIFQEIVDHGLRSHAGVR